MSGITTTTTVMGGKGGVEPPSLVLVQFTDRECHVNSSLTGEGTEGG